MNIVRHDVRLSKKMREEIIESQKLIDLDKNRSNKVRVIWNEGRIAGLSTAIDIIDGVHE